MNFSNSAKKSEEASLNKLKIKKHSKLEYQTLKLSNVYKMIQPPLLNNKDFGLKSFQHKNLQLKYVSQRTNISLEYLESILSINSH